MDILINIIIGLIFAMIVVYTIGGIIMDRISLNKYDKENAKSNKEIAEFFKKKE